MGLNFLNTIIISIVEGLTEFAPVSSTAHILVTGKILGITSSEFFSIFTVVIQSGAILAAVIYFWKTIWSNISLIPKVIVGFIPTAIVGFLLKSTISKLFSGSYIIGISLIIGGIIFLFLKPIDDESTIKNISYKESFLIGCSQILAFIPGVSRSGATLIGGTLLGISRSQIVIFSFILGIPTILGASVLELKSVPYLTYQEWFLIFVGLITAFITAFLTIKFFINLLTKKPLFYFAIYRIVIGVLVLFLYLS
jgi:undecaprenyl-diphosphatase